MMMVKKRREEDEENDEHMKICTFSLSFLFFFLEKNTFFAT
jgi:hypothetical protein